MVQTLPDPFYYLENFRTVLRWIAGRHADLLDAREQDFIAGFGTLPQAAQALLVRMVMRKGELFRQSRLHYAEIGDIAAAARPLVERGWVDAQPLLTLEQLSGLLKKEELVQAFGLAAREGKLRKDDLLALLKTRHGDTAHSLAQWHPDSPDTVYALCIGALCERFRLLYFGNLYQDWSEFVLADLGVFTYEKVDLPPSSRAFQSRADVDSYLHLYQCRERLQAGEPVASVLADIPALPLANPWLENRRAKLLFQLGQQQEKLRNWAGALQVYASCHYAGARSRHIRVLERLEEHAAALSLAEAAAQMPESEEELQQLARMLPRLRRKRGMASPAAARPAPPEIMELTLPADPEASVEMLVCAHINQTDTPAFYVENALINSLFGLLCWPAIFAPLPGAFFHPFQSGPADLHAPDFYQRRAALFEDCLDLLESAAYRSRIIATWRQKQGLQSPFVFWGLLDEALLTLALDCIPAVHLRLLFTRLSSDIKSNRSGFPDLVQFWPEERRYRMLEVKGPGDRLQDNQLRWLDYCQQHGIPVAVAYVQWAAP
jgi:hypothetical protein